MNEVRASATTQTATAANAPNAASCAPKRKPGRDRGRVAATARPEQASPCACNSSFWIMTDITAGMLGVAIR